MVLVFIFGVVVGVVGGYFFFRNNGVLEAKIDEIVDDAEDKIDEAKVTTEKTE